uniref:Putative secreted protein n=1 Tax=Anopheles darlingi TaxID=43151 RepID=A0A2M4DQK1_ANODA
MQMFSYLTFCFGCFFFFLTFSVKIPFQLLNVRSLFPCLLASISFRFPFFCDRQLTTAPIVFRLINSNNHHISPSSNHHQ